MEEKLIEFIKSEFITEGDINITSETKLISGGIIDSFSLFSLQSYIEREFGKKIPPPVITAESFDTVKQMIDIINKF
jgi:acyl carrier protein